LYFFTLCTHHASARLTESGTGQRLLDAVDHYHATGRWHAHLFLLMPDHVHALISFPSTGAIAQCWRDWKRFTAKQNRVMWQRDFFEHRIRNDESWEEKASYIRANPVRKQLVRSAEEWPWFFEGR
jgi:putative transposase